MILRFEICELMLNNKMIVTAEYLPSSLNIQAEPRRKTKPSERKGNVSVFQKSCAKMGTPWVDLFAYT